MKKVVDFIKPAAILLLVAAVVALVLGGVNMLTEDTIARNNQEKVEKAMQAVLPADSYEQLEAPEGIDALYEAASGGWVVQVTKSGSQGNVTMMVGVDTDLACTGISITASSETAGLGAIASQQSTAGEAFRSQFVGQVSPVAVTKDGGQINALTGATITSRAVSDGVTAALDACAALG